MEYGIETKCNLKIKALCDVLISERNDGFREEYYVMEYDANVMITKKEWLRDKIDKLNISNEVIYIYGTGIGAWEVTEALKESKHGSNVVGYLDRNDSDKIGKLFDGKKVESIERLKGNDDIIILVAAREYHRLVFDRVSKYLKEQEWVLKIIDIYEFNNTDEANREYINFIQRKNLKEMEDFIQFKDNGYHRKENDTKIIAYYLPQYYQFELNNKFHGQGFTEWTNTSQAIPQFVGHYQPHVPYDVGYYELLNPETLKRQVWLANKYGIYGFCFHYYWFSGQQIMEKPLQILLEHKELDIRFCINWATENWTSLWDGGDNSILLEQTLRPGDEKLFFENLMPIISDSRYIKINGKPVIIIYKVDTFEKSIFFQFMQNIRIKVKKAGFPDLYVMTSTRISEEIDDISEWGIDALVEYPPHRLSPYMDEILPKAYLNPYFKGKIYDAGKMIENRLYFKSYNIKKIFRTALTAFDNTARKCLTGASIYWGLTPETYKQWLSDIILDSKENHDREEDIVFVNAWNEWAEGAHLEPDMKYGYAYLQKTFEALMETNL